MRCDAWSDVPAEALAELFDQERTRWRETLGWDIGSALGVLEDARASGHLPGLVARDHDGRLAGWCFYVLRNEVLDIGSIVGTSASAVRSLLDGVLSCPEAELAKNLSCFVFPSASSLRSALERRHFDVTRFDYLERAATPADRDPTPRDGPIRLRGWDEGDAIGAVRLLARAYERSSEAPCFAPHGELAEWAQYLGRLLGSPGCGTFMPERSIVAESRATQSLAGLVLVTRIAHDTAHVAQVAVDPASRRHGVGASMIRAALSAAREAGCRRVTLLVAEHNEGAQALYAGLGFGRRSQFLFASRRRPARTASAPAARRGATALAS